MRAVQGTTVLRRIAQGHRAGPDAGRNPSRAHGRLVRLQTHGQRSFLRRNARAAGLSGSALVPVPVPGSRFLSGFPASVAFGCAAALRAGPVPAILSKFSRSCAQAWGRLPHVSGGVSKNRGLGVCKLRAQRSRRGGLKMTCARPCPSHIKGVGFDGNRTCRSGSARPRLAAALAVGS